MKKLLKQLHWQILISMLLGIILGTYVKNNFIFILSSDLLLGLYEFSVSMGTIFIKLLKVDTVLAAEYHGKPEYFGSVDLHLEIRDGSGFGLCGYI